MITVHDFGLTENGQPYMVMDLIEGMSLADLIEERGSLPLPEAVEIFLDVCDALEHAHGNGVLHRDLKPGNIMLAAQQKDGGFHVHLVDFGMAKIMDTGSGGIAQKLTQTGELFGSPLYMSPEQCMGRTVDQRSDIYSLGCILYESLVGWPPHQGETLIDTIFKHLHDVAAPLDEARTDIVFPQAVVNLVAKLLANKPEERFQTISQVKQELLNIQSGALQGKSEKPGTAHPHVQLTRSTLVAIGGALMLPVGLVSLAMATITLQKAGHNEELKVPVALPAALPVDRRIPAPIEQPAQKNLAELNLKGSKLTAKELSRKIQAAPDLRTLSLDDTAAGDETLRQISRLAKLETLSLRNTPITDTGLKYLVGSKSITELIISGTAITDSGIDSISHLRLTLLRMWDTNISENGLNGLANCQTLQTLTVSRTKLSVKSLLALSKLHGLTYLQLYHIPNFHDVDLKYLQTLKLKNLYFENCPLTDDSANI